VEEEEEEEPLRLPPPTRLKSDAPVPLLRPSSASMMAR
jgi:hypothetical protein